MKRQQLVVFTAFLAAVRIRASATLTKTCDRRGLSAHTPRALRERVHHCMQCSNQTHTYTHTQLDINEYPLTQTSSFGCLTTPS